jgi:hypothetical protein
MSHKRHIYNAAYRPVARHRPRQSKAITSVAMQQFRKCATVLELLIGSVLHPTMEMLLEAVFSMDPLRGYSTRPTELGLASVVQWSGASCLVSVWVTYLEDCCGEGGSWSTGTVREPRRRGMSDVGSRYQEASGEGNSLRRLSTCRSELLSLCISDSAVVTCSYDL